MKGFWSVFHHIPQVWELKLRTYYHLMREEKEPLWEDPSLARGGVWRIKCPKRETVSTHKKYFLKSLTWQPRVTPFYVTNVKVWTLRMYLSMYLLTVPSLERAASCGHWWTILWRGSRRGRHMRPIGLTKRKGRPHPNMEPEVRGRRSQQGPRESPPPTAGCQI